MYKEVTGDDFYYEDPRKTIRDFYQEFCDALKNNLRATHNGEEVYLHDVLMDLNLLGHEGQWKHTRFSRRDKDDVLRDRDGIPKFAITSQKLRVLKNKYCIVVRNDEKRIEGVNVEDTTKNLFKLLCAMSNITIRQRGRNPLKD